MQLVNDRIAVMIEEDKEQKTVGGIYIPVTAQDDRNVGTVVYTGPGRTNFNGDLRIAMPFKSGDRVAFSAHAGQVVTEAGTDYLVLSEIEVLAILDEV